MSLCFPALVKPLRLTPNVQSLVRGADRLLAADLYGECHHAGFHAGLHLTRCVGMLGGDGPEEGGDEDPEQRARERRGIPASPCPGMRPVSP